MESQLFVSVIIPVYNGATYLPTAIENIVSQDYHPFEIIVIDDGSTDGTAEVAAQFKNNIRYVYQENSGPAAARNRGIKIAKGEAIAFLDVDDLWSDDALKLQAKYLTAHPSVEIVQGLIQQMKLCQLTDEHQPVFEEFCQPYNFISLASALYRKSVFDKVGLLDETLIYGEDADWFVRAWEKGVSKVVLDRVVLFYRRHQYNMTGGQDLIELGFLKIFKKYLDRCRKKGQSPSSSLPGMPKLNEYVGTPPKC